MSAGWRLGWWSSGGDYSAIEGHILDSLPACFDSVRIFHTLFTKK